MILETIPVQVPDTQPLANDVIKEVSIDARELRSQWIDSLLDPENTLPQISVVEDPKVLNSGMPELGRTGYRVYDGDSQPVGLFRLASEPDPNLSGETIEHLSWIQTDKPGKGYGKAMYLNILKMLPETATLVSDKNLQPGSFRMWQWLESRHLAIRNPGELSQDEDRGYIWNENHTPLFRSTVPNSQSLQEAYKSSTPSEQNPSIDLLG